MRIRYLDVVDVTGGFYVGVKGIVQQKRWWRFQVKTPEGLFCWVSRWNLKVHRSEVADKFRNLRLK